MDGHVMNCAKNLQLLEEGKDHDQFSLITMHYADTYMRSHALSFVPRKSDETSPMLNISSRISMREELIGIYGIYSRAMFSWVPLGKDEDERFGLGAVIVPCDEDGPPTAELEVVTENSPGYDFLQSYMHSDREVKTITVTEKITKRKLSCVIEAKTNNNLKCKCKFDEVVASELTYDHILESIMSTTNNVSNFDNYLDFNDSDDPKYNPVECEIVSTLVQAAKKVILRESDLECQST